MRTRIIALLTAAAFLIGCAPTAPIADTTPATTPAVDEHLDHPAEDTVTSGDTTASTRHQEWVEIDNNGKKIFTFVVYPEVSEKVPVVLVIHENKGLNDWAKRIADQIAEAGYIAVAPDLLSGADTTHTRTSDFASDAEATAAIGTLDPAQVTSDLNAVAAYAQAIPASNRKLASAGFCWGGSQSFALATANPDLDAAMVFYGTAPKDGSTFTAITAPVYGFYGGSDERVNATIETTDASMKAASKQYDYEIYNGAGHAFMRTGEDPGTDPANVAARKKAWDRMMGILKAL